MAGQVVTGKQYFPREKDENKIWRRLQKGSHILLLAPRRVGKTSLLRNLERNPKAQYIFLYSIVQSCSTEHEYYKAIIENLFKSNFTDKLGKVKHWGKDKLDALTSSVKGLKLSELGIEFDNKDRLLNHNDLKAVLETINIDKKLILVIDEFPDVLEKINEEQGHSAAVAFLSGCRELWQDPALDEKMQFILTGSIGLDTLVSKLNLSNLINVLNTLSIEPFSEQKADEFVDFISHHAKDTIELTTQTKHYLLEKVGWLMPYYIEILWTSLEDLCCDEEITKPTKALVDKAYDELFSQTNRSYFIHWVERLTRFAKVERQFAAQLLAKIADTGEVANQVVQNLKQDSQFADINGNYVCDCLEHDGYIFFNTAQNYQFTSPLLKGWWRQYAARNL
jgi:hypothetical protein